ncbi:hypothetical protein ALC57_16864 [Trachymyrmex cornetzi]|uniref:Uncharacterized protein n=1 Tax=Trachymyrmex cornetzi TaxID=471704 RepID=A0A151IUE2_9HYME|nr:hypothetical protein ALC57_16864 [Trachymyrmex cornetzi]
MVFYYIYLFPISSSTEPSSSVVTVRERGRRKEGRKILGSWLVRELTFFMDTDSTGGVPVTLLQGNISVTVNDTRKCLRKKLFGSKGHTLCVIAEVKTNPMAYNTMTFT